MRGLARVFALTLLIANAANAGVPSPWNSTVPKFIVLVGTDASGVPDTLGRFRIVVRDVGNNPVPGANVSIDFAHAPAVRLCRTQPSGATVECSGGHAIVHLTTDARGEWNGSLMGMADPFVTWGSPQSAQVFWDTQLLREIPVAAVDLDGHDGVGANDFSKWLDEFARASVSALADYDGSGTVGTGDLSIWLTVFGMSGSATNCDLLSTCP